MDANSSSRAHHKCLAPCLLCKQWMASSLLQKRSALTTSVLWLRKAVRFMLLWSGKHTIQFSSFDNVFCRLTSETLSEEATLLAFQFHVPQGLILPIWLNRLLWLSAILQIERLLLVKDTVSGIFWSAPPEYTVQQLILCVKAAQLYQWKTTII